MKPPYHSDVQAKSQGKVFLNEINTADDSNMTISFSLSVRLYSFLRMGLELKKNHDTLCK